MNSSQVALACRAIIVLSSVMPMLSTARKAARVASVAVTVCKAAASANEMRRRSAWRNRQLANQNPLDAVAHLAPGIASPSSHPDQRGFYTNRRQEWNS